MKPDEACEHGTALDVHCCNCHSGFLFDVDSCVCVFEEREFNMNPLQRLVNQQYRGEEKMAYDLPPSEGALARTYQPRTFKETIQDQIAFHESKVKDLKAVLDSMSPEVEKFVEALQKIG